jgi:predicted Zn-dependent protease
MIILVMMISAILMVLAHGRNSFENERFDLRPDALSEAYLKVFLKAQPDNHSVRLQLAKHYLTIGEWVKARLVLRNGGTFMQALPQAKWLTLQVLLAKYSALPRSSPQRKTEEQAIRDHIATMELENLTTDQILQLADISLQMGAPDFAATYYVIMAKRDTGNAWHWYAEAGRWSLAANRLEEAATYYELAYQYAPDPDKAAMLAEETLRVYEASMSIGQALVMIRRALDRQPLDQRLLLRGINMAIGQHQFDLARKWNLIYLKDHPDDLTALDRQIALAVQDGHKQQAFEFSKRYIALDPVNNAALRRHAELAEWNGFYPEAISAWQSLAQRTEDPEIYLHLLHYAQTDFDVEFELKTIAILESRPNLKEREALSLAARYEYLGYLDRAERLLNKFGRKHPNSRVILLAQAELQEQMGDWEKALLTRQELSARSDATDDEHLQTARLLYHLGRYDEAYDVMKTVDVANIAEKDYAYELIGELAWQQGDYQTAASAYYSLWEKYPGDEFSRQRLIVAKQQLGQTEEAIQLLNEHWRRTGDRSALLAALTAARQADLWPLMDRLFALAETAEDSFARDEEYWLLKGDWHSYRQEYPEAYLAYRQAFSLNSRSTTAAEGILWSLINAKDHDRLDRWVNNHIRSGQPLTEAHAVALQMLGRGTEALVWYEGQYEHHQNDVLWLLDFADLLEAVGRRNTAYKVRKHALTVLMDQKEKNPDDRIAELTARLHGVPIATRWLNGHINSIERATVINWWLYRQQHEAARIWLLRHHIERSSLPAWQQLQLALAENDHTAVSDLLKGDVIQAGSADRMNAYLFLGRRDLALAELGQVEQMGPEHRQAAVAAAVKIPNLWEADIRIGSLGSLGFRHLEGLYWRNRGTHGWGLTGVISDFEEDEGLLTFSPDRETRLTGSWRRYRDDVWAVDLGYRDGNGGSVFPLDLSYRSSDRRRWQYQLGLQSDSETTVSGLLRLLGVRDRINAQIEYQLDPRLSVFLSAERHRYQSLGGSTLAHGNTFNFSTNYRLLGGSTQWLVGGSAAWEANNVVDRIPDDLQPLLSPQVSPESLVPDKYSDIGLSMYLGRGQLLSTYPMAASPLSASPRWFTDLWVGYIEPESTIGVAARAGIGTSLFGGDELGLTAAYDDRLNRIAGGGPSYQIQLYYRFYLGR